MRSVISFVAGAGVLLCGGAAAGQPMDLTGTWGFRMDPEDVGVGERWYERALPEQVRLPGSMNENGKGDEVTADTPWTGTVRDQRHAQSIFEKYLEPGNVKIPFWLQPDKVYVGPAWYQREVEVPASWAGNRVVLFLERCHWTTQVWVDSTACGARDSLSTPHEYDLTEVLSPGPHTLTVRVDNTVRINVGRDAHSVSDNTQTNWNGIVGRMELRVLPSVSIADVRVYPELETNAARVEFGLTNATDAEVAVEVKLTARSRNSEREHSPPPLTVKGVVPAGAGLGEREPLRLQVTYPMGDEAQLWSEFSPTLYELIVTAATAEDTATCETTFGMREIGVSGTRLTLNGEPIYLRGTLECCIFPKTGYPPTDVESWLTVLRKAKACGLNHLRFHSWCPPEAAFDAADQLEVMYQVEGPFWATVGEGEEVDDYVYAETERILKAYGNHPSFCLLAYGNEPGGGKHKEFLGKLVEHWKQLDGRHLYTSASGWPIIAENEYHVTPKPRVHGWGQGLKCRFNATPYESRTDYGDFVAEQDAPVISHEIGQWCVYPNFDEIAKYTGPIKPRNFEIFRDTLTANGMGHLAHDFLIASGKLQALCYKEEIEAALRTKGFAGFQLLDLHDFPGQGTALVGVLDPFWDEKGYITYAEYRRFCGPTVPLLRMDKCVWTSDETFSADVEVTHYGAGIIPKARPQWKVTADDGGVVAQGAFPDQDIPRGTALPLGRIELPWKEWAAPARYTVTVEVPGTEAANAWSIWVYAQEVSTAAPKGVHVVRKVDDETLALLNDGARVLLLPEANSVVGDAAGPVPPGWSPIFWNTLWTQFQPPHTLGLLCDPAHPALAAFPTEFHSNWQWWDLVHGSQIMVLDNMPTRVEPVVRVIDDWVTNRRLALVFEARVGTGRLLVCGSDLATDLASRPVARQMRHSLLDYMASDAFTPETQLTAEDLGALFREPPRLPALGATARADSSHWHHPVRDAIDGNPKTFWHTDWTERVAPHPHWLVVDLGKAIELEGVTLLPRQDMNNGLIGKCRVYVSDSEDKWGRPAAKCTFGKEMEPRTVKFKKPQRGRYIKLEVLEPAHEGHLWTTLAELDILERE